MLYLQTGKHSPSPRVPADLAFARSINCLVQRRSMSATYAMPTMRNLTQTHVSWSEMPPPSATIVSVIGSVQFTVWLICCCIQDRRDSACTCTIESSCP